MFENFRSVTPVKMLMRVPKIATWNFWRAFAQKWPEEWPIDDKLERECLARKCKKLTQTPDYGFMNCSKTPELNTLANQARYCRPPLPNSYDCVNPPRNKNRMCVLKCKIYIPPAKKSKCAGQCGRRSYSTRPNFTEDQESETILNKIYSKEICLGNFKKDYNKRIALKCKNFTTSHIFKHFMRNRIDPTSVPLNTRTFSTFTTKQNWPHYLGKIITFFRARPNCPTNAEYKKRKLIEKVEKLAKKAGLELCTPQTPQMCPILLSNKPPKKPTTPSCKQAEKCPKMCLPGCKPPADRINCVEEETNVVCTKTEAPRKSFSETRSWEFSRPRVNECTVWDDMKFMAEITKMKSMSREKRFSTFAPTHTFPQNLMLKRTLSTDNATNKKSCENRPLEPCATCKPLPLKPPVTTLVPGMKPPCKPLELPPLTVVKKAEKKPCPVKTKPKKTERCGLPHRSCECLIDKCKRYRECCRPPPEPKVYPCEEEKC